MEIFEYDKINIDFQWIGHMNSKGNVEFTGAGSLNYGMQFIKGRNPRILHFFLIDCDTKREESDNGNIVVMTVPYYNNHLIMNKGIENALELNDMDLSDFYEKHEKHGDYDNVTITKEFDKMKMYNHICGLDTDLQKKILVNLKSIIERIVERVNMTCGS